MKSDIEIARDRLSDRLWRLNHLYWIITKTGEKQRFELNNTQQDLFDNMHFMNVILKARQLGITTYIVILFLDICIFNSNCSCGIVADTRENAENIFKKVKFAFDNLPEELKKERPISTDTVRELVFSNGSSFRVGTSLRSSTCTHLHISEFGKIAAQSPERAKEIISGSLNTVQVGQYIFVESTAQGTSGKFYDLCKTAQEMKEKKVKLSQLDWKFHFYPWFRDSSYQLSSWIPIQPEMQEYFTKLKVMGIELSDSQKMWYIAKCGTQREEMKREFPSYPQEAFLASSDGLFFGPQIVLARSEDRIGSVPHDASCPCFTAWDLGYGDASSIWVYQLVAKEIHLIEYIESSGQPLTYYLELLSKRPYKYEKHFVPHDAAAHELSTGLSRVEVARNLGFNFTVAPRLPVIDGIDICRTIFNRCWFDESKCDRGISCLENFKKDWNDRLGTWEQKPLHNWASHGADAFRVLATTLKEADNRSMTAEDLDRSYNEAKGFTAGGNFFNTPPYAPGF
jgi:hypothetical protein